MDLPSNAQAPIYSEKIYVKALRIPRNVQLFKEETKSKTSQMSNKYFILFKLSTNGNEKNNKNRANESNSKFKSVGSERI